eukprot:CAMPEP_0196726810 /NCGR_PEP_ID=MMETSP1091-20130531/7964_1 /TAXON_ID=302021 /ORGANISM="Rhodomonas sp., Strain CCMP768" /LENGTH=93 /DNA_ID=CAMNT_0042069297 /DNA_START=127 /DNA_END=405 /DNA_ORIENTATION=+
MEEFTQLLQCTDNINLDVLHLQTRREGLPQLVSLLRIRDAKSVQVCRAPDLKFRGSWHLLDLDGASILPASNVKKILNLLDLFRHRSDCFARD